MQRLLALKKSKPKVPAKRQAPQKPVVVKEKIAVAENAGVLREVTKTNALVHDAIKGMVDTLSTLEQRPKKLRCNINRNMSTGLADSIDIEVIE